MREPQQNRNESRRPRIFLHPKVLVSHSFCPPSIPPTSTELGDGGAERFAESTALFQKRILMWYRKPRRTLARFRPTGAATLRVDPQHPRSPLRTRYHQQKRGSASSPLQTVCAHYDQIALSTAPCMLACLHTIFTNGSELT